MGLPHKLRDSYSSNTDKRLEWAVVKRLARKYLSSVAYHSIFNYPLTKEEIVRWQTPIDLIKARNFKVAYKNGMYYPAGKHKFLRSRLANKQPSERKMEIARKAAYVLAKIPMVRMVAVTGSLAMNNSSGNSDIDLMIVASRDSLWATRALSLLILALCGIERRRPKQKYQKDLICLNIWLDETGLSWPKDLRNIYTAHELSQIIPIVNKGFTYERLMQSNLWIKEYWPNAVPKISRHKDSRTFLVFQYLKVLMSAVNKFAFIAQYLYMKPKMTNERVSEHRAFFHPRDLSSIILSRLGLKTSTS